MPSRVAPPSPRQIEDRDRYAENAVAGVLAVADTPVSTFSIDVDTGSYANVRRMLTQDSRLPPQNAVRTEELLNYFRYDYPAPRNRNQPFTVSTSTSMTPWNPNTRLLRVGLRGYDVTTSERPAANLVFLVDVSGSMQGADRLGLVQCTLAMMAEQMTARDRVSIVVYAGAAGQVLAPTSDRRAVIDALDRLRSGGSTAGGAGLALAYRTARENFREGSINRILLATDGDFNVGVSNNDSLLDMIERERRSGIQLSTLGYGRGNFNEALMEQAADRGNGVYAYIDSIAEARRVMTQQVASTLFTIAHDVKIQVEFNPALVSEYRLIGYENRALAEADFTNDAVDAGEIGAGHEVTALYEIVPAGTTGWLPARHFAANRRAANRDAMLTGDTAVAQVRLRYKLPGESMSRPLSVDVPRSVLRQARAPQGEMAFAVAVAGYGQLLRGDTRMGRFSFADAAQLARPHAGRDAARQEFVTLAERAEALSNPTR
jgi:Ca-activated chloride channel family protein